MSLSLRGAMMVAGRTFFLILLFFEKQKSGRIQPSNWWNLRVSDKKGFILLWTGSWFKAFCFLIGPGCVDSPLFGSVKQLSWLINK